MALEQYEGPGTLIFDGDIQAEAQTVRLAYNSNARPVTTMRKGLAGRSVGPGQTDISITSALPRAGMEGDFLSKCVANAFVRVVVVVAGKRYQVEGWIQDVSVDQSQDNPASVSCNVTGRPPVETG